MSVIKHTVKDGEYLDTIAEQYGTTAKAIGNANAIKNLNLIYPGQELIIPASASAYSSSSASGGTTTATRIPSTYTPGGAVTTANESLNALLAQKPNAYTSNWMDQLKGTVEKILQRNEEGFNYDLNGDALYQQYKDKYIQQGKLAMHDAIGQASAMTGGYGNSYAQSVGQQQYQASLDNLNDIVPELYQMAYDRYAQEGQDLYNQFAMYGEMENLDYGRHRDTVTDWQTEREYLTGLANTAYDRDYKSWADALGYQQWSDEMAYQQGRDKVEDEKWQKEYDAVYGKDEKEQTGGFTGSTYSEAVAYAKKNGVPSGAASGIMDQATWNRKKNSGSNTAEVKNYKTYQEYLADIVEYLIEQY